MTAKLACLFLIAVAVTVNATADERMRFRTMFPSMKRFINAGIAKKFGVSVDKVSDTYVQTQTGINLPENLMTEVNGVAEQVDAMAVVEEVFVSFAQDREDDIESLVNLVTKEMKAIRRELISLAKQFMEQAVRVPEQTLQRSLEPPSQEQHVLQAPPLVLHTQHGPQSSIIQHSPSLSDRMLHPLSASGRSQHAFQPLDQLSHVVRTGARSQQVPRSNDRVVSNPVPDVSQEPAPAATAEIHVSLESINLYLIRKGVRIKIENLSDFFLSK